MGQCSMVHFNIQLEIIHQIPLTQKSDYRCAIKIILMFGRLHGFRFDEERSFETILSSIVTCSMKESRHVLLLAFHIRVQQGDISFTTTPENIILTPQGYGGINCILHLRGCITHHIKIRIGRSTIHVAGVTE